MSSTAGSVVSPLSAWAETHTNALYQASTKETFDDAYEAYFAKHTEITINGKNVSRAHHKQEIWSDKHDRSEVSATVCFPAVVEVLGPASNSNVDSVAVFLNVTIQFANPVGTLIITASCQLTIIEDPSLPLPSANGSDRQRVSAFDAVTSKKSGNIR